MDQLQTRRFAGVDFGKDSVQLSIYDEADQEMTEESRSIPEEGKEDPVGPGVRLIMDYLKEKGLTFADFNNVVFSFGASSKEDRDRLARALPRDFHDRHNLHVITRFRAFAEYVFHQEKMIWDRNTLLLDYSGNLLSCILIDQLRQARQKAYQARILTVDLKEEDIVRGDPDLDVNFGKMIRQFLAKHPAQIVFLTGDGFEGNWMKKTLNVLCAGRRVFLGKNLYANGACLSGIGSLPLMDEGLLLLDGPDMVCHTIGIVTSDGGKTRYEPVTTIGREWYNTKGSKDIILDRSGRVEFFYHNAVANEIEGASCEIRDLPKRPPKTTRIRIRVVFSGRTSGTILLEDLGFGDMYPGTGKITIFPFALIS